MKQYVVYFRWIEDDFKDSFICNGYKELIANLADIQNRPEVEVLSLCEISKYGEYMSYPMIKKYAK